MVARGSSTSPSRRAILMRELNVERGLSPSKSSSESFILLGRFKRNASITLRSWVSMWADARMTRALACRSANRSSANSSKVSVLGSLRTGWELVVCGRSSRLHAVRGDRCSAGPILAGPAVREVVNLAQSQFQGNHHFIGHQLAHAHGWIIRRYASGVKPGTVGLGKPSFRTGRAPPPH